MAFELLTSILRDFGVYIFMGIFGLMLLGAVANAYNKVKKEVRA